MQGRELADANKTAEQIATEVNRRFIPAYKAYWTAAKQQADQTDTHEDNTLAALELVKGSPLDDYEKQKRELSSDMFKREGLYGKIKASGNDISMEIRYVTPQQARKIIDIAEQEG